MGPLKAEEEKEPRSCIEIYIEIAELWEGGRPPREFWWDGFSLFLFLELVISISGWGFLFQLSLSLHISSPYMRFYSWKWERERGVWGCNGFLDLVKALDTEVPTKIHTQICQRCSRMYGIHMHHFGVWKLGPTCCSAPMFSDMGEMYCSQFDYPFDNGRFEF